jgi:hypothetical protein
MRSTTLQSASLVLALLACTSEQPPTEPSTSTRPAAAGLAVTGQDGPKHDFVKGTAEHLGADPPFPVIQVRINARSDAAGTDAKGYVTVRGASPVVPYTGRVTCLNVRGNEATIGIEIVKSSDPALEGQGQLWNVVDGTPDQIAGFPLTPTPPTDCAPLFFSVPVISGDYVIHDAVP